MRIEDVLKQLRARITIILVTNLVLQSRRLADRTAFFLNGELVEVDRTEAIFSDSPANRKTYEYVHGKFGLRPRPQPTAFKPRISIFGTAISRR